MEKKLEEMTFEELVTYVALQVHSALLEGGGKGMKSSLHLWLGQAVLWANQQPMKKDPPVSAEFTAFYKDRLKGLLKITRDCREDMHEPDEQEVRAMVTGKHLDNAHGEHQLSMDGEYVVHLKKGNKEHFDINLANLIALARKAVL